MAPKAILLGEILFEVKHPTAKRTPFEVKLFYLSLICHAYPLSAKQVPPQDRWLAGKSEATIAKKRVSSPVQVHRIIHLLRQSRLEGMECSESPPIYNVWNYSSCDPRFGQNPLSV